MTDTNRTAMILDTLADAGPVTIIKSDGETLLRQRRWEKDGSTAYIIVELGRGADVESAAEVAAERWLGMKGGAS
jgi:hypothetical protein